MNEDIVDLQKRLSFQEHAISDLQDIVDEQAKEIEGLKQEIELLKQKMPHVSPIEESSNPEDEKPPHY